jgi:exosortase
MSFAAFGANMDTQATNGVLEEFRLEFLNCWQRLPNKAAFFVVLVAWLALFQFLGNSTFGYFRTPSLFGYMYGAFSAGGKSVLDAEEGYALLIPIVVLYLFWRKRQELLSCSLGAWWPGLLILTGGAVLHLLGYCIQQPRISVVGFFVGVYGLTGMVWGTQWLRGSFFPFILFAFCVPIGSLAEPITFRLRILVSQLVGFIAHYLLAIDVIVQGNLLIDPTGHYQYEVAAACSGIRSLIATLAMAVILAFVSLQGGWKRLVLILSVFPLAVLGNLFRMLAIVIAAEVGGQEWGNFVHEGGPGGILSLLPYVPAFVGLLLLERYLKPSVEPSGAAATVTRLTLKQT